MAVGVERVELVHGTLVALTDQIENELHVSKQSGAAVKEPPGGSIVVAREWKVRLSSPVAHRVVGEKLPRDGRYR